MVFEGLAGLARLVLVTGVVGVDLFVAFFVGGTTTFDLDDWAVLMGVLAFLLEEFLHTVWFAKKELMRIFQILLYHMFSKSKC